MYAQFSKYEIGFLFYWAVSKEGREKIFPLAKKYNLFEYLDDEVVIKKEDKSLIDLIDHRTKTQSESL